jgi:hypothetical protein
MENKGSMAYNFSLSVQEKIKDGQTDIGDAILECLEAYTGVHAGKDFTFSDGSRIILQTTTSGQLTMKIDESNFHPPA